MAASQEHEQEITRLQDQLGDLLTQLRALPQASDQYSRAADATIAAAHVLIDYEERVPQLLDVQPRRISGLVLRGCGAGTMALAAVVALRVVPGGRPWWWLPIAVVLAVAGARLLTARLRRSQAAHLYQRQPAIAVAAAAVLATLGMFGAATGWLLGLAALLLVAALVLAVRTPGSGADDDAPGEPLEGDWAGQPRLQDLGRSAAQHDQQNQQNQQNQRDQHGTSSAGEF